MSEVPRLKLLILSEGALPTRRPTYDIFQEVARGACSEMKKVMLRLCLHAAVIVHFRLSSISPRYLASTTSAYSTFRVPRIVKRLQSLPSLTIV